MKKKKIILIAIAAVIVLAIIYNAFIKKEEVSFELFNVVKGDVSQEVSETGQVQMGKAVNLGFKNAGTLDWVFVKVGDKVWPGSSLARQETVQLNIELNEYQAALDIAQAKLDQLLEGATPEEIQAAQTDVETAQIALEDAEEDYENDVNHAYEDALVVLDDAYLKVSAGLVTVSSVRRSYFYSSDQESITVVSKESEISSLVSSLNSYISQAYASSTDESIDNAISFARTGLATIYNDMNAIKAIAEGNTYTNTVSSADKTALDTARTNANTALTSVTNAQQAITSAKTTGQTAVNTAKGNLQKAQDDLALLLADPSQSNITLYQAQVSQAQAKVDLYKNKITEATLKSPVQGQVIAINREIGETVQPSLSESVITILPATNYEIEVDIYEEDIVKMEIGNSVDISLIAFPDEVFSGRVISINPAEDLIDGVVYYAVKVNFENFPEGIKPGMTADLSIKVAEKTDVLSVPEDAIQEKDGKNTVKVYKDKEITEKEIEIGLIGSDDMVEVISGLAEGEQVVIE